jgi:1-deoxy-D-xylulose-5-phosphate reductoisomerase
LPDFAGIGSLTFQAPEFDKFPCLALAFDACEAGGTLPSVLNAANEIAVYAFLETDLAFTEIPKVIAKTMEMHTVVSAPGLADIVSADRWARETAEGIVQLKTP